MTAKEAFTALLDDAYREVGRMVAAEIAEQIEERAEHHPRAKSVYLDAAGIARHYARHLGVREVQPNDKQEKQQ